MLLLVIGCCSQFPFVQHCKSVLTVSHSEYSISLCCVIGSSIKGNASAICRCVFEVINWKASLSVTLFVGYFVAEGNSIHFCLSSLATDTFLSLSPSFSSFQTDSDRLGVCSVLFARSFKRPDLHSMNHEYLLQVREDWVLVTQIVDLFTELYRQSLSLTHSPSLSLYLHTTTTLTNLLLPSKKS